MWRLCKSSLGFKETTRTNDWNSPKRVQDKFDEASLWHHRNMIGARTAFCHPLTASTVVSYATSTCSLDNCILQLQTAAKLLDPPTQLLSWELDLFVISWVLLFYLVVGAYVSHAHCWLRASMLHSQRAGGWFVFLVITKKKKKKKVLYELSHRSGQLHIYRNLS